MLEVWIEHEAYFNTKKVRLKLFLDDRSLTLVHHFNTKKVRLKQASSPHLQRGVTNFNTKKVRLKPFARCFASPISAISIPKRCD